MIGSSMMVGMPTDRANQLLAIYGHTVDTGEPLVIDGWRAYSADGRDGRYFDLRGVKVGDGLSLSAREVTDRVRSAEALAASERQARDLAERYEQARDEALEANAAKTGLPLADEPRAAHAAQRDPGLRPAARARGADRRPARVRGADPHRRSAPPRTW